MDELGEEQRIAMEGFRPGAYLRLRFTGVPCELMQHFDPAQPLLVGGGCPPLRRGWASCSSGSRGIAGSPRS